MNKVEAFISSIPYMKIVSREEIMITVFDHEKYLHYEPSSELDFKHKPGDSLPEAYLNYAMVNKTGTTVVKVPKEEFGVPFDSISFAIKDEAGEILAGVNVAVSKTKEETFNRIIQTVDSISESLLAKVQHIAAHAEELSATSDQISDNTKNTVEYSSNITSVTGTIKGISEQINLLGLNAAIEAARVGSAGAGFGVVAEEVRKLAAESKNATASIEETLQQIQNSINQMQGDFNDIASSSQEEAKLVSEFMSEIENLTTASGELKAYMQENIETK
ncbi:methyl-accepting chemotaxis protein [Oceanobacillus manasiensis]|uniref:methyl-accepting chemotaxis protein n=1 Tax=Oceanobacillus manasiensis TaxID=586413 RepID=UPI0005A9A5F5|nr:methyl-accepting chemotaxis protein [Oceanobacillus manasiensis]